MTLHTIRLYVEPPKGESQTAVSNWVANHPQWVDPPVDQTLQESGPDDSDTDHLIGTYHFEQEVGNDALLDDLEQRLQNHQGGLWYRVGYHRCSHDDEEQRSGCKWEETREWGDIPTGVPTFDTS